MALLASDAEFFLNTDSLDSIESLSSIPDFDEWWISIFLENIESGHQHPSAFASHHHHQFVAKMDANCVPASLPILHHHEEEEEVEVEMTTLTNQSNKFVLTKRKRENSITSPTKSSRKMAQPKKSTSPLSLGDDYEHEGIEMLKTMASYVNQGDASALRTMLRTRCTSDVELTMKYKGGEDCPYSKSTFVQVCGRHAVVLFCETMLSSIPDTRMGIQETKCKLSAAGLVTLSCRYAFTGTKALLMACDRCNSLIVSDESKQQAALPSAGDDIIVYAIEGDNRHKTLDNIKPVDRLVIGVMEQPMNLKLYGAIHVTINPVTGMITKLFISHSQKKR